MILWIILFLLVVGISFLLSYRSMKDYQEIPHKSSEEYGLFLVRQTENFNINFLERIQQAILSSGLVISIERLFKGGKAALVIFGPKSALSSFTQLNLLELEDYAAGLDSKDIVAWELGAKGGSNFAENIINIFKDLPELREEDQFFWQVVLGAKKGKDAYFQTQIRAIVYSPDPVRKKTLSDSLQNLNFGGLVKIPRPFSTEQVMAFYKLRSLSQDSKGPILSPEEVIGFLKV